MSSTGDRPVCPACSRKARPGIACWQLVCPFEKAAGRTGVPVLARPLKKRHLA